MATKATLRQRRKLPKLEYSKRPRIIESDDVKRWIWRSKCGRYRVVRSHCKLAESKPAKDRLPDVFYAMTQDDHAKLLSDSRCLVVYEHEYGWLVLVPQDDVGEALAEVAVDGHSEAFQTLLRLAHEQDIRMIRFDRDGDLVARLETFGW